MVNFLEAYVKIIEWPVRNYRSPKWNGKSWNWWRNSKRKIYLESRWWYNNGILKNNKSFG